jgi:hypothetical protein
LDTYSDTYEDSDSKIKDVDEVKINEVFQHNKSFKLRLSDNPSISPKILPPFHESQDFPEKI